VGHPGRAHEDEAPHRVYLSRQARSSSSTLLKAFGSEPQAYVFPSILRSSVPLGEATLNHFFKRLDFGVPDFSPHGTRGTAATLLREHGFSRDVVELLLAHAERNKVTAAYHHHEMAEERRRALQYLADQIETSSTESREARRATGSLPRDRRGRCDCRLRNRQR
jgi:integrase